MTDLGHLLDLADEIDEPHDPTASDDDDDDHACPNCDGTGEGMFDGQRCITCHGKGSL